MADASFHLFALLFCWDGFGGWFMIAHKRDHFFSALRDWRNYSGFVFVDLIICCIFAFADENGSGCICLNP